MSSRRWTALVASRLGAASGLTWLARAPWRSGDRRRVIILAYHDFAESESEGRITPGRLARHLDWLAQNHDFHTVSSAVDALAEGAGDRDIAVLTFDDGYAGNYGYAWPELKRRSVPATIYLSTGFLDGEPLWFEVVRAALGSGGAEEALTNALPGWRPGHGSEGALERLKRVPNGVRRDIVRTLRSHVDVPALPASLTWDQVREMKSGGIEFGSHSVSHAILSSLSPHEQERELRDSRARILEETGSAPRSLAVPNGSRADFDHATLEAARAAGYDSVCTMLRGWNAPDCDPLRLRRIGVGADPVSLLHMRVSGLPYFLRRLRGV